MHQLTLEISSNEELWELFDKSVNDVFIHQFNPVELISWWKTDLKLEGGKELKNLAVREMQFDLQTDLSGLKQIMELNVNQLRIYQFDKPVPDTLTLERLPEESKYQILKQNGLKHFFWVDFEFLSISSFDSEFIQSIVKNPKFAGRIKYNKLGTTTE